jgi:hypothetical protein
MACKTLGKIAFALISALPIPVFADAYNFGPFYVGFDDATNADDRDSVTGFAAQSYKQLSPMAVTVFLCATTSSLRLARSRQRSVRLKLIGSGVPDERIRIGNRCGKRLRLANVAKDAVVVIVGPSGS